MTSSTCTQVLRGHIDDVYSLSISPDGRRLASGSRDNAIKIWDIITATCIQTLYMGFRHTRSVAFESNTSLRTETGTIKLDPAAHLNTPISPTTMDSSPYIQGYGIHPTGNWITWNNQRVMWLPTEYQPLAYRSLKSAVIGTTIAIACASGRILVFKLSTDNSIV